jgi:phospholipid/cholesterol/gamma-HCH transport system substrate-binding protein
MAIKPATKVKYNLVIFLVLALGLSYLMATQVLTILKPRISVYAIMKDAGGVFTSQEVTYRGVTVGQVGTMAVVPQGVKIQLLIKANEKIPEQGVEANVLFKSAVGEQFVDLDPTTDGAPFLKDGSVIPLAQTSVPVSTQALLTTLQAVLKGVPPSALKGTIDALGRGLNGQGPNIGKIIESSALLAQTFAQHNPDTIGILNNGTKIGGAFLASRADFERAIRELVTVSDALKGDTTDIHRLLQSTSFSSDQIVALLTRFRKQIDRFLPRFATANEIQAAHADDLTRLLQFLPTALGRITKAFEPATGMVRFGLVTDTNNPGCQYGTKRRPPSDRTPRTPPKHAHCAKSAQPKTASAGTPTIPSTTMPALPGVTGGGLISAPSSGLTVPNRISHLSWALLYLNSL